MKMKTALALSAAVIVASTGGAMSKTQTTSIAIDGFCDVFTVKVTKTLVAVLEDAGCEPAIGGGVIAKVKNFGNSADVGLLLNGDALTQYVAVASYPFMTGGSIDIYFTDGDVMTLMASTTYSVVRADTKGPRGNRPLS